MGKDASKILAIAEPIAAERGLEILDIEFGGTAASPLLRVLLDSPDEERRVGTDDCQDVSRRLGDALDAYDLVRGGYMLEVSSPGLNRPLRRPEHFRRVLGRNVKVRTKSGPGQRHTWTGRLDLVDEDGIQVVDEAGEERRIGFDEIEKANLEFEFGKSGRSGRSGKQGGRPGRR